MLYKASLNISLSGSWLLLKYWNWSQSTLYLTPSRDIHPIQPPTVLHPSKMWYSYSRSSHFKLCWSGWGRRLGELHVAGVRLCPGCLQVEEYLSHMIWMVVIRLKNIYQMVYMVVFSVTDSATLREAEALLQSLWQSGHLNTKAVIVVGNKIDLVRNREVPIDGEFA